MVVLSKSFCLISLVAVSQCAPSISIGGTMNPLSEMFLLPDFITQWTASLLNGWGLGTQSEVETQSGTLSELFPISHAIKNWTVSALANHHLGISVDVFRPTHMITELKPKIVIAPDNRKSLKAHYPKGSYNFQHDPRGGFSFYAPGPSSVDLTQAREATLGYTVYFPKGFNFVKGGKLPGFYGGDTADGSISCSGGRKADDCFSVRMMWRAKGAGEIYAYVPPYTDEGFEANEVLCSVPPYSECNPDYGNSVGRGAFKFTPGKRAYIATRVKLNDVGKANGEMQLWADGKSVINVTAVILRDASGGRIRGIQMQTFFGGSDTSYATPKNQDVYFADFSVAITEEL